MVTIREKTVPGDPTNPPILWFQEASHSHHPGGEDTESKGKKSTNKHYPRSQRPEDVGGWNSVRRNRKQDPGEDKDGEGKYHDASMIHRLGEIKQGSPVGGKATQLDILLKAGFPVPPGIAIDADSWQDDGWLRDLPSWLPLLPGRLYAVRSSAVGEDGAARSMAGMFQSLLKIKKSNVISSVNIIRTHALTVAPELPLAVLIQPWIDGACSGVTFSRHPTRDYGPCFVTDALSGQAKQVVDGTGSTQRLFWWPDGHTLIPKHTPLSTQRWKELARLVQQMETIVDRPIDVEWTFDEGRFFACPMTHLPPGNIVVTEFPPAKRFVINHPFT